jgi:hypothetical protein
MQLRNVASLLAVQVAAWSGELEATKMLATARASFDFCIVLSLQIFHPLCGLVF